MKIKASALNSSKAYLIFILSVGVLIGILSTIKYNYVLPISIIILLFIKKAKARIEYLIALSAIIGLIKDAAVFSVVQDRVDLTLLLEMIILIFLLIDMINRKAVFNINNKVIIAVVIFIGLATASLLFVPKDGLLYSFSKFAQFAYIILISKIIIPQIYIAGEKQIANMLKLYLIFGIIVSAYAFISNTRESFLPTYISAASSAVVAFTICFSYYMKENNKVYGKALYLLLGVFFLYTALFTGARGPVVSLIGSYILYGILDFTLKHKISTCIKYLAIICFVIFAVVMARDIILESNFGYRLSIIINGLTTGSFGTSGGERIYQFNLALNLIKNNFFTGVGIGTYSYYANGTFERLYPHNIFLEVGAEMGMFAVIVFVLLLIYVEVKLIKLISAGKGKVISRIIFILFNMSFIEAQFSGNLLDNKLLFLFMGAAFALDNYLLRGQHVGVKA